MADVLVERVLLGRLIASGLTRDRIAQLVAASERGSPTASRILDQAVGGHVFTRMGPAMGMVQIAPGLGWRDGTLFDPNGTLPETIIHAAVGLPIGNVIDHPDIDPAAVAMVPEDRRGALAIRPQYAGVHLPWNPVSRFQYLVGIVKRRNEEKPISTRARMLFAIPAAISCYATVQKIVLHPPVTAMEDVGIAVMAIASFIMLVLVVDALTARAVSETLMKSQSSFEMTGRRRHEAWLRKSSERRGFDDDGARTS